MKKIFSMVCACAMGITVVSPLFAATAQPKPALYSGTKQADMGNNEIPLVLDIAHVEKNKPQAFSVTIPTMLPIMMDDGGNIMVATNASIRNNGYRNIRVTDIHVSAENDWTMEPYVSNFKDMAPDSKVFGLRINNCDSTKIGFDYRAESFPVIAPKLSLPIRYDLRIPRQTGNDNSGVIGRTVFVIGWDENDLRETPEEGLNAMAFNRFCKDATGTICFKNTAYHGNKKAVDLSARQDTSVMGVKTGNDVTIYCAGGVKAPSDSTSLFSGLQAQTLDLTNLDTSNVVSMYGFFRNTKAKTIKLGTFNTEKVKDTSCMFAGSAVEHLDLSKISAKQILRADWMFTDSKLKEIDLSGWDLSQLESAAGMFQDAKAETINITGIKTPHLKNTQNMFAHTAAKTLDLKDLNTERVETMSCMFYGAKAETLDLSEFKTDSAKDMNMMFKESAAKELDLRSFKTDQVESLHGMFHGAAAEKLDLSSFDLSNVIYTHYMFADSKAKTVYCRTENDLLKMKDSAHSSVSQFEIKS